MGLLKPREPGALRLAAAVASRRATSVADGRAPGLQQQTIACSTDWQTVTRLWETDPRHQKLAATHSMFERVHMLWRKRWNVGGNEVYSRPKRFGIGCQSLRAQTAVLIEWMLICWREGFLTGRQQRRRKECTLAHKTVERMARVEAERKEAELEHPYGPAAVRLRIKGASLKPPSRRAEVTAERKQRRKSERAQRRGESGAPPARK